MCCLNIIIGPKLVDVIFKSLVNGLEILDIAKIWRRERNMKNCELYFPYSSKLLQDVAYGVIYMIFGSGNSPKLHMQYWLQNIHISFSFTLKLVKFEKSPKISFLKFVIEDFNRNKTSRKEKLMWPR